VADLHRLTVRKVSTGETFSYFEDQVQIEIDEEGLVSITTPDVGSREFLLTIEQLEALKGEL